ncbi:MAG: UDP-3-O-(3-hydroxymyristoyl)glucosamine N-acyltransferase [Bdellovibrionota bacterium]
MYIQKQNIKIMASNIAEKVGGKLFGTNDIAVSGVSSFDEQLADSITFFTNTSEKKILEAISKQKAKILLINELKCDITPKEGFVVITCKNAHKGFLDIIPLFFDEITPIKSISEKAEIGKNVNLGENFSLGAFSVIGDNTTIGNNVVIYPNVIIYQNVKIGNNVIIHSGAVIREGSELQDNIVIQNGAVIGADGFGYVPDPQVGIKPVPQVGNVKLASFVDVGANACIDRAAVSSTHIGYSTKIDNLVQIGHNVNIGKFSIICGATGIAGSTQIGDQVTIAGGVGVADHVKIADGIRVGGRSVVDRSLTEKGDYAGYPIVPVMKHRRLHAVLKDLPETLREIKNK